MRIEFDRVEYKLKLYISLCDFAEGSEAVTCVQHRFHPISLKVALT